MSGQKLYEVSFWGRKKGAIGIMYAVQTTVRAESADAARVSLYANYEHISGFRCRTAESEAGK